MIEHADVYKNRVLAARLTREAGGTLFSYDAEYLTSGSPPVASTLPLRAEPVFSAAGAVPAFFAGLLPEGRRLTALRTAIKASADDELALLAEIGGDTIGDVQIIASGESPSPVEPLVELPRTLEGVRFDRLVADSAGFDRVGLPGVQDKVSGKMIALPAARAGERFILKLNPPEYPHVVENEAFFIGRAKAARIPVVRARLLRDAIGTPALLVTRFDRVPAGDGIPSLRAVEDACQALGLWPASKYAPTTEAVIGRLGALTAAPAVAARDAFRQIVFAILTGNGDVHAKNLSVLAGPDGEFRISPAYDLPSTVLYGDTTLALSIQGRKSGISRRILLDFAEEIGLRRPLAERLLGELLTATADLGDALAAHVLPFSAADTAKTVKQLAYRRRLLGD